MNLNPSPSLTDAEKSRIVRVKELVTQDSAGIEELIGMLPDPSWLVRREVVSALAKLGMPAVVALCGIIERVRGNESRNAAAVDALVASQSPVEKTVLGLASHEDPAVVADVVQILGRRKNAESVPHLIQLAGHADDNVAVGALEALGKIGGRAAVEALIATTRSGNFFRTFPAIDVLGRSGDPRAVEPLAELLKNPSYLPESVRALGRTGEKSAAAPLIGLLKLSSDSIVRLAATALWELREKADEKVSGSGDGIDAIIRSELSSDSVRRLIRVFPNTDSPETIAFCNLFGVIADVEAADTLTLALDRTEAVAISAARALKKIGKDADDRFLLALREGSSERRKVLLPMVMRSSGMNDVVAALGDVDADVRSLACDALARIGNGAAVARVFPLLSDSNARVVHSAVAAIQSLGTREARDLSRETAKSENPGLRRAALRILGYFGDADSLPSLLAGLKDSDPRVHEAALHGLPYLEDSRAVEALIEEAKGEDDRFRGLAVRSLGQVPKASERIYSLLLKSLKDSDPWVRYYACQALGRQHFSDASKEIADRLQDEAGQVRVSAVEALSHLESPEAYRALRDAAQSDDADVKRAALVGLGIAHRPENLTIILSSLNSRDVPTRLISLSALVNFESPLVLSALKAAGRDSDEQVRSAAIAFLAARSEPEATEILVELLTQESTSDSAKAALLIPSPGRIAGLLVALHSANDENAPKIVSILIRMNRNDAKNAVLSAMKLNNVAARKAAASAMDPDRSAEMKTALEDAAVNDPNPEVRKICALRLKD